MPQGVVPTDADDEVGRIPCDTVQLTRHVTDHRAIHRRQRAAPAGGQATTELCHHIRTTRDIRSRKKCRLLQGRA